MMLIPRLLYFVPVMAGLLASSGCTRQASVSRAHDPQYARTGEELRVARQSLPAFPTTENNYFQLDVTGSDGKTVALFLSADEVARLKTADHHHVFEIRYWYREVSNVGHTPTGQAELESIRDAQTVILDGTRCRLHDQIMTRRLVPITYGLAPREYFDAMTRDFPHAATAEGGCIVGPDSPKEAPAYVCSVCDAAYRAWKPSSQ